MILRVVAAVLSMSFSSGAAAAESEPGERAPLGPPSEAIDAALHWIATGIEVVGVSMIVIGAAAATVMFVYTGLVSWDWAAAFQRYRARLGRGILLGLELLVAADIIGTVAVAPSFENLAVLGVIVLIRTFLSFSLQIEIEGRLPWRRAETEHAGERL